jgi:hypothetical protein
VLLRFHNSVISTDAGPLAYGELDDAVSLTGMAGEALADARTGKTFVTYWLAAAVGIRRACRLREGERRGVSEPAPMPRSQCNPTSDNPGSAGPDNADYRRSGG